MSVLVPDTQVGNYLVEAPLGQGGMATVYRVRHGRLGSIHALKVLSLEFSRQPEIRQRFLNEGRIQAQLRHPNLVPVTDLLEDGEFVGLVMDFVEGEPLDTLFRNGEPPRLSTIRDLLLQVLAGLAYVHARNIVHRDLKPSNIIVDRENGRPRARILDFGIAKIDAGAGGQNLTEAGTTLGTLKYMSPEQVRGEAVGPSSDLFSLGVLTYQLVTGRLPFNGDTQWRVQSAIVNGTFEPVETLRPDLPPELIAVIHRSLGLTPAERFPTADAFAEALREVKLEPSAPSVPSIPAAPVVLPRAKLRVIDDDEPMVIDQPSRTGPIVIGLLLVAALGAGGWYAFKGSKAEAPRSAALDDRRPMRLDPKSGLEFVLLPGGGYLHGCEPQDRECFSDEKGTTSAQVDPFWFGRTEVSVDAWAKCVKAKACSAKPKDVVNESGHGCNWREGRLDHPINCTTHEEAETFCAWVGGRLPSATEWEYAAKSGESRIFPWGDAQPLATQARFDHAGETTSPVGLHPGGATPWGLLDLAGNVWEWTSDEMKKKGMEARGGSWKSKAKWLRTTNRFPVEAALRSDSVGFRCLVEESPEL